jgi:hypothetical protein
MNNSILNFEKFSIVTPHHLHDINCKNLNIIYYKDDNKTGYREGRITRVDLPNKVFISFRGEEHKKAYTIFLPNPRIVFVKNYSLKKPA